jgi:predicted ATPase/DNA-binding SARP family transcriptional activator
MILVGADGAGGDVEFRVLGPLEVVVDGQVRRLSAGAERALLELLLLNAGRVIPVSGLVDALWGEDLPANAGNALQGRISRLRRALAAAGLPEAPLVTRRPGYMLDVDPDSVDAHRFARLVGEARRLTDHGRPVEARRLYDDALALWPDGAEPGFAEHDWGRGEASRLAELRLAAVEERIDLDLAGGRHQDVVAELEALTARQPIRERLHGQLMLALYRSGRQADALAVYQRIRQTLGDELGLDPSAELRALEQAILRQEPQLRAPARAVAATPAASTHNLPGRLTSFVGRGEELSEVRRLVAEHRLVTLTGPGGSGKTSLAIQAAMAITDGYADGVWLVRLAGLEEADRVPRAVADTLRVPDDAGTAEEQLVRYLGDREILLVLDNCEHLVDASAGLAEHLLVTCPRLRLLATSREPLAVPGEVQLAVPPLPTPPPDTSDEDLPTYDAVQLFVDRARGAVPAFTLDASNAPHVGHVCRQLDGIPLAIELAAARTKTLPIGDIAARLDDRFRLLAAGPRTAEVRQQTLRATVDWSHQLLPERDRVLFRRLSVFRGGWNLEAAERVCSDGDVAAPEVLELLGNLVDRSLVVADHRHGARFRMLETLRHYGRERLAEADEADRVATAHARYFTEVAERGEPELRGPGQGRWLRWLADERDNLRAALAWCLDTADADPDLGLRLVAALGWFWYFASNQEGRHDATAMLAAASRGSATARARALQAHAVVARPRSCIVHPSAPCAASARESLDLFGAVGDRPGGAMSQTLLAVEAIGGTGRPEARVMLAEANEEFVRAGDDWGQALVLFVETELSATQGDLDEAARSAEQALTVFRRLGDHWGVSAIQYHLGLALHRAGRLHDARDVYEAALAEGRRVGLANTVQYLLANLGLVALLVGDTDRAEQLFPEARAVAQQLGAAGAPLASLGEGLLGRVRGNHADAQRHFTEALRMLTTPETGDWAAAAMTGLGYIAELTGDLDAAERQHRQAWRAATDAGLVGNGAAAAALEGLACVAAARDDGVTAARLLGAAARWRDERGRPASPMEQADIDRAADRARTLIGEEAYGNAWHQADEDVLAGLRTG